MSNLSAFTLIANGPADSEARKTAVDTTASVLVQAPAGSGKTTLLTQRFLALLSAVDDPRHIVAITFTTAAAAEMRHRILSAINQATTGDSGADPLAIAALHHAKARGWDLLDQPALLRISTIDSFCRELALQEPLLSGLGGGLSISELPENLYLEAARRTLAELDNGSTDIKESISDLLLWRDNSWFELEQQIVAMLSKRDRWMQDFLFDSTLDQNLLRAFLERPFARVAREAVSAVSSLLSEDKWPEIQTLAEFASGALGGTRFARLAGCYSLPSGPFNVDDDADLDEGLSAFQDLADLLLTKDNNFRKKITKTEGFPAEAKAEKARYLALIENLAAQKGFGDALTSIGNLPPIHFSDADWRIVRACFVLLRHAVGHLKGVFAEVGKVDFTEVSQIAQQSLYAEGAAGEGSFSIAQDIHHLLVDEFQDTSRRQHGLLAGLISHWDDRIGRTCFVVGDPLQSIYFFRDADAELFPRVKNFGLELFDGDPLTFTPAQLTANFRTVPSLVERLNSFFSDIFSADDGSGLSHTPAIPARKEGMSSTENTMPFHLHLSFVSAPAPFRARSPEQSAAMLKSKADQVKQIVELVQSYQPRIDLARKKHEKFRVAILSRAHKVLIPIALGLREAGIPFRAIDLEPLSGRPETIDAIGLARALLNKEDRVAWLGVLRSPWCGLSLSEIHNLTSGDDPAVIARPVSVLAASRLHLLSPDSQIAVHRILDVTAEAAYLRASQPTQSLGAWLEAVWLRMGGGECVDAQSRANLDLLWTVIDQLPNAEQDLLGPALDSALSKLTAQPDPAASSDCGVQLMTIHKSKGLEFEVVIVPELQASTGGGTKNQMLSWLERGINKPDESGDLVEFLLAPYQAKGTKGGAAKKWVDSVYRDRERQESRRLLYVAATRARDELHFFARPEYRVNENDGSRTLVTPSESLLATAWPAIEVEARAQFALLPPAIGDTAAAAPTQSTETPHSILHRLPPTFTVAGTVFAGMTQTPGLADSKESLYARESGGAASRAVGTAVHSLLETFTLLRSVRSWEEARFEISDERPRLIAQMRAAGLGGADAALLTDEALKIALATAHDPLGQWVLDPHADAGSEIRWTSVLGGKIRTVQADRVFRGGSEPYAMGEDVWWIVDYKTADSHSSDPATALPALRTMFAPQLEIYARVLRQLHGDSIDIRAGLYYPRFNQLDWWKMQNLVDA